MTTAPSAAPGAWTTTDIPDQRGRTAVVTGGNSGLGIATVEALAAAGAHVVLAVRDPGRGEAAATGVNGSVEVRRLDLADLASVREFAAGWRGGLDLLINNAGVMNTPESRTTDGFETQFGTNHLGHFALTNLLVPYITDRIPTPVAGLIEPFTVAHNAVRRCRPQQGRRATVFGVGTIGIAAAVALKSFGAAESWWSTSPTSGWRMPPDSAS